MSPYVHAAKWKTLACKYYVGMLISGKVDEQLTLEAVVGIVDMQYTCSLSSVENLYTYTIIIASNTAKAYIPGSEWENRSPSRDSSFSIEIQCVEQEKGVSLSSKRPIQKILRCMIIDVVSAVLQVIAVT